MARWTKGISVVIFRVRGIRTFFCSLLAEMSEWGGCDVGLIGRRVCLCVSVCVYFSVFDGWGPPPSRWLTAAFHRATPGGGGGGGGGGGSGGRPSLTARALPAISTLTGVGEGGGLCTGTGNDNRFWMVRARPRVIQQIGAYPPLSSRNPTHTHTHRHAC